MSEEQQLKQKAIDTLRMRYEWQRDEVVAIETRLGEYYDHLCQHVGVELGDTNDLHNLDELLGAIKFLRLLRQYEFDTDIVRDVIYKYEGEWVREGKRWKHTRGGVKHPGLTGDTYYRLQPYQVFVLAAMFGPHTWVNTYNEAGTRELLPTEEERDGTIWDLRRLCTEFTLYTPRKTAKTQLSAFIQFWFFMCGDQNAECMCCANASDQAKILFSRTKSLIHQMDPEERRIRFTASQVNWREGQFRSASLTALSAGGKTKDGLFAQLCSADEFGSAAYVNGASDMGKLVSVIESSMGPRREPMTFISTTAGIIRQGPFIEKLAAMQQALRAELDEDDVTDRATDRQMCLLLHPDAWERDQEVLLTTPTIRRKINPMLGIVCQHSFYDDEVAKARQNPEKMNEVVSKLFNVYQAATVREWIKPDEIRALQVPHRVDECVDGNGWMVYAGLDFSKGDDLNGVSYLCVNPHTGEFFADMDAWMSQEAVNKSPLRELFTRWAAEGWLHIVPGKTFEPSWPVNRIIELNEKGVNFLAFGYDPYNAKIVMNALSAWLFDLGLDPKSIIVPVRQNYATYNPAVNEMDYMVKRSRQLPDGTTAPDPMIHFSQNPMWPWEFGNTVLMESNDGMGNRKPVKGGSDSGKVDNVQMLLSALLCYDMAEGMITS